LEIFHHDYEGWQRNYRSGFSLSTNNTFHLIKLTKNFQLLSILNLIHIYFYIDEINPLCKKLSLPHTQFSSHLI
jgi:hypothetical protein